MHRYKGSGLYWRKLLKKHGDEIDVDVLGFYFREEACKKAALDFSIQNDIVKSRQWANLVEETGVGGAFFFGEKNPMFGKPSPQRGVKRPWVAMFGEANPMFGKPSPMRGKKNLGASLILKGRPRPEGGGKPSRAVVRLDDGVVFESIAKAAASLGKTRSGITKCCMGKAKSAHGYKWAYKE